jgi:hypothetical protein
VRSRCFAAALAALSASSASAQSFNLDISNERGVPSDSFGAVGQPGVWNVWTQVNGAQALRGLDGATTGVTCTISGATNLQLLDGSPISGDDGALMNEWLGLESTAVMNIRFDGLAPGPYRVLTYAWHGGLDFLGPHTRVDVPGSAEGPQTSGGFWPGEQRRGTTYTEHTLEIAAGASLTMIVDQLEGFAGAVNGIQLVQVPASGAGALVLLGVAAGSRRRRA